MSGLAGFGLGSSTSSIPACRPGTSATWPVAGGGVSGRSRPSTRHWRLYPATRQSHRDMEAGLNTGCEQYATPDGGAIPRQPPLRSLGGRGAGAGVWGRDINPRG